MTDFLTELKAETRKFRKMSDRERREHSRKQATRRAAREKQRIEEAAARLGEAMLRSGPVTVITTDQALNV